MNILCKSTLCWMLTGPTALCYAYALLCILYRIGLRSESDYALKIKIKD